MPVATFPLGPLQTNSYLLHQEGQAIAVDVGGDPAPMLTYLADHKLILAAICLTHRHFDHMYGVAKLSSAHGAPVFISRDDDCLAGTEAADGGIWGFPKVTPFTSQAMPSGTVNWGGMECCILQTPGHTPGGVSLYFPAHSLVFTGDALFYRSIGRSDFPGGDLQTLLRSIKENLFTLPADTIAYPGHGPATSIGDERSNNPFCGDFAE
ncbi:MAG: MBL fold metallo-hydrolase [Desulfovibrio sp.]|nr:MBL fold metallo-hydrolase [Desulfovibrio sp.]